MCKEICPFIIIDVLLFNLFKSFDVHQLTMFLIVNCLSMHYGKFYTVITVCLVIYILVSDLQMGVGNPTKAIILQELEETVNNILVLNIPYQRLGLCRCGYDICAWEIWL